MVKAPAGGAGAKKPKIEIEVDVEKEARAGRVSTWVFCNFQVYKKINTIQSPSFNLMWTDKLYFFQLSKLTVAVLKDFIKKQNIDSDGTRKAELIDAISSHFGL